MMLSYYPNIKTTPAELRAFQMLRLDERNESVVPIVQLTKPRISTLESSEALNRHIVRSIDKLDGVKRFIIGITDDETFQDANLNQYILDSTDSYIAWRERLDWIEDNYPGRVIPSIIGYPSRDILDNYKGQIISLIKTFHSIAIRIPAAVENSFQNLGQLVNMLGLRQLEGRIYYLFDFGFVDPSLQINLLECLKRLEESIADNDIDGVFVPLYSSCPPSFPIYERDSLSVESIDIMEYNILRALKKQVTLSYGDYALIHPQRHEGGIVWYPRIDYPDPISNLCYYCRYFNKVSTTTNGRTRISTTIPNEEAYRAISKEFVTKNYFRTNSFSSWGHSEIENNTTADKLNGKSPQFYISIRSNIHMENIISLID